MERYIPRFFTVPEQSFFLFGPRGTGKSTFLRQTFPNALWVDLLRPDTFRLYAAKPERLFELIAGNADKKTIVIDEIQKVPELLSVVHSLIEEKKQRRFVLTGSSVRKLKRVGINLLAGRALYKTFHPFLYSELDGHLSLSLEDVLQFGLLPVILNAPNRKEVLDTYVSLYVREEVQYEGFTRNIGNFSRFLEAVSFSHGSVLNISNVARECEVERKTVESYIQILEDVLLAFQLPVFERKAKRKVITRPKFYFFDTGVFQTLRPKGPLDSPGEIDGAALEGLVIQQLRTWNAYSGNPFEMYFWRTRGGAEVDLILYGEKGMYAIEVKNSSRIRKKDLRHLKTFRKDYPVVKTIFLFRGHENLVVDGIRCMPVEVFLKKLRPGSFPEIF